MHLDSIGRRQALGLLIGGSAALAAGNAHSQGLPSGTIRMLVGFPAGGGSDVMARVIVEALKKRTGANIVVDNKPGASGLIAGEALKGSPPDGTVIMFAPSAATASQKTTRKTMPFDLETELTPISLSGVTFVAYAVSPSLGVKTLAEYLDWLKKNPTRAHFGTTALGGGPHIVGVRLGQAIGVPLEPIGYKGAAPLVADLTAGHVPAATGGLSDFLQYHRADRLRIIALSSKQRSIAAPELPTMIELGYPSLFYEGWYAFYGPMNMQPEAVAAWNREIVAVLDTAEVKQKLLDIGMEARSSTPSAFADMQKRDIARWTEDLRAINYQPE